MARSQQAVLAAVMAWRCSGSVRASYDADRTSETTQAAIFLYRSRLRRQHANPEVTDVDHPERSTVGRGHFEQLFCRVFLRIKASRRHAFLSILHLPNLFFGEF